MRVTLVGADLEENLGLGMIAASLEGAGHKVVIVPFDEAKERESVARRVLASRPELVGLGIQFQHRAHDFLALSRRLRALGFEGHLTCGGQFPTMAYREVLTRHNGVDSVVLHEGEETVVELAEAVSRGAPIRAIRGLAIMEPPSGAVTKGIASTDAAPVPTRNEGRPLGDLDRLPFPTRYRPHSRHLGIPFVPIMASRGCWGSCAYCSITTFYRDARAHAGGRTLRRRSPKNVATEMALLWHAAGGPSIFCFHDDNFFDPRPADTLARVRAIRAELDDFGVGKIGIIGKCRPDTVDAALLKALRALGVIRLYIGIENASQRGADHLGRRTQNLRIAEALRAAEDAEIFTCYNLLLFEPDATLDDVAENVAFIREHATHPVNFCRAEPYYGTPMHRRLEEEHAVTGSYLGFDYRVRDDRTELLFRICAAAFRERNFAPLGVGNRTMGLGYAGKVLAHFHPDPLGEGAALEKRATELTRQISLETADLLEKALRLARDADLTDAAGRDRVERETALLGLEIAALDAVRHRQIDALHADMDRFAKSSRGEGPRRSRAIPARLAKMAQMAQGLALASALGIWSVGCGGKETVADPVPPDGGKQDSVVSDPVPPDTGMETMVADPVPEDTGFETLVVDALPPDAGVDAHDAHDATFDSFVADPPPPDTGIDAADAADAKDASTFGSAEPKRRLLDQFRDTSPQRSVRSDDLPLSAPPTPSIHATREGDVVHVQLRGTVAAVTTRWQGDGLIDGEGTEITWTPSGPDDALRVAVRSKGGVAVVSVRAHDVS
jgi:radical SAM superfamily enzyme YgiQ (UPF0313 family)